jgi:lysophospholipase L1-like esterase
VTIYFAPIPNCLRGSMDCWEETGDIVVSRLPSWTRAQFESPATAWVVDQTSGVHLAVETAASWIEVELVTTRSLYPMQSPDDYPAPVSVTIAGDVVGSAYDRVGPYRLLSPTGEVAELPGSIFTARFELGEVTDPRIVKFWLPHNAATSIRALRADAPLRAAECEGPRWIHYGSSISHAAEAETPLGVWPVAASRALDLSLTNLGFSGNAHLDQFVARAIRDAASDVISLEIGINLVNMDSMKRRTFIPAVHGFLDTIRDGHPTTPILVISPIIYPAQEDTPGPIFWDAELGRLAPVRPPVTAAPVRDGSLTLRDVRIILEQIVGDRSRTDSQLTLLSGLTLFGNDDIGDLPDGLHPSPAGYARIARRFTTAPEVTRWLAHETDS